MNKQHCNLKIKTNKQKDQAIQTPHTYNCTIVINKTSSYLKVQCVCWGCFNTSGFFVFKILCTEMFEPAEFTCFSEERLCRKEFLSCGAYRLCRIFCSVTLVYPQFISVTESYVSQTNEFQIIKVVLSLLVRIYYWAEECHNVLFQNMGK